MKRLLLPLTLLLITFFLVTRNSDESNPSAVSSAIESQATKSRLTPSSGSTTTKAQRFVSRGAPFDLLTLQSFAGSAANISIPLAGGESLSASVTQRRYSAENELLMVEGTVSHPASGRFLFQKQPKGTLPGPFWGFIYYPSLEKGWGIESGPRGSFLVEKHADALACRKYEPAPQELAEVANFPNYNELNIDIPPYQNGVIPVESLPGATAVLYIDFDGEQGPHSGWGDFYAQPHNLTNPQRYDIWRRVAEDFAPFNINVTTDLAVFEAAPRTSRQRNIHTVTTTASPGAGGVAYLSSFNSSSETPCWSFNGGLKSAAETISHEFGHTLRLRHDGNSFQTYYPGHGSGETQWGPIMGGSFDPNLTQWSKGEYSGANNRQDDLNVLTSTNNNVNYRLDDHGSTHSTATTLSFLINGTASDAGVIETSTDVDAFRFSTSGGSINLSIDPLDPGPNLDLSASLHDISGSLVATSNPINELDATLNMELPSGSYTVRVTGTGKDDVLGTGYSDYGSLGKYRITGSVTGLIPDPGLPRFFEIAENNPVNAIIGTVTPIFDHGSNILSYQITSGDSDNVFSLNNSGKLSANVPLDFEASSFIQGQAEAIALFITITDTTDPSLTEDVQIVVQVTDINEPPTPQDTTVTILERTQPGRLLPPIQANDPDYNDSTSWSITAGNSDGTFQIDNQGHLSLTSIIAVEEITHHTLTLTVADSDNLTASADVTVSILPIADNYQPGGVTHTFYRNITSHGLAALTNSSKFPYEPDDHEVRDELDASNDGDNYGRTTRAFLIPPITGDYTFWLAGDSSCALLLSPNEDPSLATTRASFGGFTEYQEWTKFLGQKTTTVSLIAGQAYYMETRQKESSGEDHISVAWEVEVDGTIVTPREPISGLFFAPHELNYGPTLVTTRFSVREDAFVGFPIGDIVTSDPNAGDTIASYSTLSSAIYVDSDNVLRLADPSELRPAGQSMPIRLTLTDTGSPPISNFGTVHLQTVAADFVQRAGLNDAPVLTGPGQAIPAGRPTTLNFAPFIATDTSSDSFAWALLDTDSPFAIDPHTGTLTLETPNALVPGSNLVTITVQDGGTQGQYPLRTTSRVFDLFIADFDSDDLDDAWELANFSNLTSRTGSTNEDGDDLSDLAELALGLDPNEISTGPIITPSGYQVTLPATGTKRFTYITQGSEDMNSWRDIATRIGEGSWTLSDSTNISTTTLGDGSAQFTFSNPSADYFFRLRILITELAN